MEARIQAIHFEITEKLTQFINKKVDKLYRRFPAITSVDAKLSVVKPETVMNKEVVFKVTVPQVDEIVATKVADTFEEATDMALEAIERQLEKNKDKK